MESQQSSPDATGADRPAPCVKCGEAPCALDCVADRLSADDLRRDAERRRNDAAYWRAMDEAREHARLAAIQRDEDEYAWALAAVEGQAFVNRGDVAVALTAALKTMLGRSLGMTETLRLRGTVDRVWARVSASRAECGDVTAPLAEVA